MEKEDAEVQLQGKELEDIRSVAKRIEKDVLQHAGHILQVLYGPGHKHTAKSVRVFPNNMKTAILDEHLKVIGVWVDPPGICRKPRKGEKFD